MGIPWYVITGDINPDNFNKLWTYERGFIWRGYTDDYGMIPPAANYDEYGKKITDCRTEDCHPLAEIRRIAEKIFELNKLQKFPFEIPLLIRDVLFSRFYQPEEELFKERGIKEFPDSSLAQAMALVQHECGGTSLLDFTLNRYKALYFAIGKGETVFRDSHIFGLNVPDFETHKNELSKLISPKEMFDKYGEKFDLLYPSYFMNDKIAHQEGVFLYQKFKVSDQGDIDKYEYKNIIDYFKSIVQEYNKQEYNKIFEKKSLDDFLKMSEEEKNKPIFYVLLTVPAEEKKTLKAFLDDMGITDDYMMNVMATKENKIEHLLKMEMGFSLR
jgi:hypothetical protein